MRSFELIQEMMEENQEFHTQSGDFERIRPEMLLTEETEYRESVPLPIAKKEGLSLQQILERRKAVRFYDSAPVHSEDLSTILKVAIQGDRQNWPDQDRHGIRLQLSVVAWRVDGLKGPVVYRYLPDHNHLTVIGDAPPQEQGEVMVLQREFAWAPAIIIVSGTFGAALDAYGSHGYRHLLTRGGAAGYRAWLAAMSLGYEGSVFAGLLPRPLRDFVGIDGYKRTQLFAFSFGKPLSPT